MQLLSTLDPERTTESDSSTYPIREAVRAVVTDVEGLIALLYVAQDKSYKLPGGGIEALWVP